MERRARMQVTETLAMKGGEEACGCKGFVPGH